MPDNHFEDFSSGRVIYHKGGMPNFPVRLAGEIFYRCLSYLDKKEITLYDPCCGNGYLLTCLGLLTQKEIKEIYASDIDEDAVNMASSNLALLTLEGLDNRKKEIQLMIEKFNKSSHTDALKSVETFIDNYQNKNHDIITHVFLNDILKTGCLKNKEIKVDLIIVDVPYGNLVSWSSEEEAILKMLENLKPVLRKISVIAVITNKYQKVIHQDFKRLEKFKVGKRIVHILQLGD